MVKRGLPVGESLKEHFLLMSEEAFNDKEKQFDDLWEGVTPNGVNRTKALKFRQYTRACSPDEEAAHSR